MTKIRFKATENFRCYDDRPVWHDGDLRAIDDNRASELVKSFPHNFIIEGELKPDPPSVVERSLSGKDKAIRGGRNK
uniref:Uncharacterized protein n=1 Tax=viral metagenome TaxID=1070528 RepID=A0A6M3JT72_9ZZZZ